MGIRVLGGESAGTIPVGKISDGTAVVNTEVMDKFGITLPDSYADAEKVTSADKEDAE
ncbi:unknown [Ruminococcus sp. CAG:353]|nr:unknown [Ruminococcus sp. CAG:353]